MNTTPKFGSDGGMLQKPGGNDVILPFKPFTLDEVCRVTGIEPKRLDEWVKRGLHLHSPDPGVKGERGLNDTQLFAVFAAVKFMRDGADEDWVIGVLEFYAAAGIVYLREEIANGRIYPAPKRKTKLQYDVMVEQPPGPAGWRLSCDRMLAEFDSKLKQMFGGKSVKVAGGG